MAELQRLCSRLETSRTLLNLVRNMKALAAVALAEFQQAQSSLESYREALSDGLSVLLTDTRGLPSGYLDDQPGQVGLVVLGSDQGLCGAFNQRLVETVGESQAPLLVMGHRAARELSKQGFQPESVHNVPAGLVGVTPLVGNLLVALERWQARGTHRVRVYLNHSARGGGEYQSGFRQLLPLDRAWLEELTRRRWRGRSLAATLGPKPALLGSLLRQWLFITLYDCVVTSLAAESGARLASMQAAEKNISERLEGLERDYRNARQSQIDAELLDISSGFQAIVGE